ncbi:UDP-N-acetylglucosamine 2-epimerase (non-hydrolyzing) [Patescibacteria group bacterium]|nr:UDP-N-acetylglucosamine 2-epimerase (non-hydrolyzing) [Patescibacteria group bacterium]
MIKVAIIFGTRPEAIKVAPVIEELKKFPNNFDVFTIASGQHKEMLDQALMPFNIKPDFNLNIMTANQTLTQITTRILVKIEEVLEKITPDLVLVQGDTPTAFVASLASFYQKIPLGHIEAGLRTFNKYEPFPEEINRKLIDHLADLYFAPTEINRDNLYKEGIKKKVYVTGNTVVDALLKIASQKNSFRDPVFEKIDFEKKVILLEVHRRESWGKSLENVFRAIRAVGKKFKDVQIVFPVHPNPLVKYPAQKILGKSKNVFLTPPMDYSDLVAIMKRCYLVVTDSGGLQEEAPTFGKPVLVVRNVTERMEGLRAGTLKLIGLDEKNVFEEISRLLKNRREYAKMARADNPYGDGKASQRIRKIIENYFFK